LSVLAVVVAACMWGTWSLFYRPADLPTGAATPLTFLLMAVIAAPVMLRPTRPENWERRTWLLLLANGALSAGNVFTFFGAMSTTTVAVAVLCHYVAPVLVALLSPFIDRIRVRGVVAASLVAAAGLALVLEPWLPERRGDDYLVGGLYGLISAVFFAFNVFVARALSLRVSPARLIGLHALIAGLLTAPLAIPHLHTIDPEAVGILAAGALLPGTIAGVLFIIGIAHIGAARAAIICFLEPLVAVLIGWLAFAEPLSWTAAAGGALILAGASYSAIARTRATAT
jgi:drug/metabolite transporter, DME family